MMSQSMVWPKYRKLPAHTLIRDLGSKVGSKGAAAENDSYKH